jgi:hypothetical protein
LFAAHLLNGNIHNIDADEHSITPAVDDRFSGVIPQPSSETVVRFWKVKEEGLRTPDRDGNWTKKTRSLVAVIPLSHIEMIKRS